MCVNICMTVCILNVYMHAVLTVYGFIKNKKDCFIQGTNYVFKFNRPSDCVRLQETQFVGV